MKKQSFIYKEEIENCERKKYNNKYVNHMQLKLKLNQSILRAYFLCEEHTKEYQNKILPGFLEKINKIEEFRIIINNWEIIINEK